MGGGRRVGQGKSGGRWRKIGESRYNPWYKWFKGERIPGYLKNGWREGRWQRMTRFRLGNGMRGNRYWEEEGSMKCRMCERERETWGIYGKSV